MEWEPNERDAWVSDAERWIGQIKGVLQSKVELDERGEISGVHVVSGRDRDPRHIVRDVESLLKARLQMDVNYKKIGVVQVMDSGTSSGIGNAAFGSQAGDGAAPGVAGVTFLPPLDRQQRAAADGNGAEPDDAKPRAAVPAPPVPAILVAEDAYPRVVCVGVAVMSSDQAVRAEVQLSAGGIEATGIAEGPNHADSDVKCVAEATIEAVARLLALPVVLHLREVRLDAVGGQPTVLVAVDLVESRRTEILLGACPARHNRQQSVVHAVLAALNRRLGLYALKELSGSE